MKRTFIPSQELKSWRTLFRCRIVSFLRSMSWTMAMGHTDSFPVNAVFRRHFFGWSGARWSVPNSRVIFSLHFVRREHLRQSRWRHFPSSSPTTTVRKARSTACVRYRNWSRLRGRFIRRRRRKVCFQTATARIHRFAPSLPSRF